MILVETFGYTPTLKYSLNSHENLTKFNNCKDLSDISQRTENICSKASNGTLR